MMAIAGSREPAVRDGAASSPFALTPLGGKRKVVRVGGTGGFATKIGRIDQSSSRSYSFLKVSQRAKSDAAGILHSKNSKKPHGLINVIEALR
jgi:hypothetical protein